MSDMISISDIKEGKDMDLQLSFLNEQQNNLFREYLNKKNKQKYYKSKLKKLKNRKNNIENNLSSLEKKERKKEKKKLRKISREIQEIEESYEKYQFLNYNTAERQMIHRIKTKIEELIKKEEEINQINEILSYLDIF